MELETQVFIAQQPQYLEAVESKRIENLATEFGRVLNGLTKSVLESTVRLES